MKIYFGRGLNGPLGGFAQQVRLRMIYDSPSNLLRVRYWNFPSSFGSQVTNLSAVEII